MEARFELCLQHLMDFPGSSDPRLADECLGGQDNAVMGLPGLGRADSMGVTGVPVALIDDFQIHWLKRGLERVPNSVISAGHNWYVPVTF